MQGGRGSHVDCLNRKLEKTIPGAPENEVPVHLRKKQVHSASTLSRGERLIDVINRSTPTASLGNECAVHYCSSQSDISGRMAAVKYVPLPCLLCSPLLVSNSNRLW